MRSENIYKYAYIGHGYDDGSLAGLKNEDYPDMGGYWDISPGKYTPYGISEMQLISCWSNNGREEWKQKVSELGLLRIVVGKLTILHREYEDEQ